MLDLSGLLDAPVTRIQPTDSNKFVLLADPARHGTAFVQVLEIFDRGGSTPPNLHRQADESFLVLAGEGEAISGDATVPLHTGSWLLVRAGTPHRIVNTGPGRLYCLTTMVPDEDFAGLVRSGTPDALDAIDRAALGLGNG